MDFGNYVTCPVAFKSFGINTEFSDPFILEKGLENFEIYFILHE